MPIEPASDNDSDDALLLAKAHNWKLGLPVH
jgi:hypothetical protein